MNKLVVHQISDAKVECNGNKLYGLAFPWEDFVGWGDDREQEVFIPDAVKEIVPYAFQREDHLKELNLQGMPLTLGEGAFSFCRGLKSAILPEGTKLIPEEVFDGCRALERVNLPDSVEKIDARAFLDCASLLTVNMPASLKKIENDAFRNCSALETLVLPEGLTQIGSEAFCGCTGLKRVVLPASLQSICYGAFQNCTSLEEIEIPPGVTQLPEHVFSGCRNLRLVVLHDKIEFISNYAFIQCDNLSLCFMNRKFNLISGEFLTVMGYPGFDFHKSYRLTQTKYPGLLEVTTNYYGGDNLQDFLNDWMLMTLDLKPIPGIESFYGLTDNEMENMKSRFKELIKIAAAILEPEWAVVPEA